jgi:hypothetical protein
MAPLSVGNAWAGISEYDRSNPAGFSRLAAYLWGQPMAYWMCGNAANGLPTFLHHYSWMP